MILARQYPIRLLVFLKAALGKGNGADVKMGPLLQKSKHSPTAAP